MDYSQKVCVIGLGYIGLPTASLLATKGYKVLGVDVSDKVVQTINSGNIHIVEPGLDILVKSAVNSKNLTASLKPKKSDIFIIAVPTPFKSNLSNQNKPIPEPDLSYIESACKNISGVLKQNDLIILESTSPVGATAFVREMIESERPDLKNKIFYAHCPERVIPGKVLEELVENDRVVGGLNQESTQTAVNFYKTFVSGEVLSTTAETAELCKLSENSFRDVNIAYANELSLICEQFGINIWELIKLANRHPRVNILNPGPGVGGHCIAVDPWFIVSSCPNTARLIKTAREVNDSKPNWVISQIQNKAEKFKSPKIICMGVAFKADIDDLRESPALNIAKKLKDLNIGEIKICEPNINSLMGFDLLDCHSAIEWADIVVILVDHSEFKIIPKSKLLDKCVIDTKGVVEFLN